MGYQTLGTQRTGGQLIKDPPPARYRSSTVTGGSGTTDGDQPRSRPLSWAKRISKEFSSSTDLAAKLKSICSVPSAVSKDTGTIFISASLTCAKACVSYWKPPRITDEHRRVASINKRTSLIGTPSLSVASAWSSSSSRKSSLSSCTSFDATDTELSRGSTETDRKTQAKGEDPDPDAVTIYGIDEFEPHVLAQRLLDLQKIKATVSIGSL